VEFVGLILFLVVSAIVSLIQKSAENKKARQRAERRAQGAQEPMSEEIPTARRKGSVQRPARPVAQAPEIEDVIRRLMGVEPERPRAEEGADEEADWQPVPPPARREIPREYQQPARPVRPSQPTAHRNPQPLRKPMAEPQRRPLQEQPRQAQPSPTARPVRQRPARTPAELMGQQQRRHAVEELTQEEIEQRDREQRWREEMERRKKKQAAEQAAQRSAELPRQRPRMMRSRSGLFRGTADLRRAIILSEVLAPPRALRGTDDRM